MSPQIPPQIRNCAMTTPLPDCSSGLSANSQLPSSMLRQETVEQLRPAAKVRCPQPRDHSRQIDQAPKRCAIENADRSDNSQPGRRRFCNASAVIHQNEIGAPRQSKRDRSAFAHADFPRRTGAFIGRRRRDFDPGRGAEYPAMHGFGGASVLQFVSNGFRQHDTSKKPRQEIDGADQRQIVRRPRVRTTCTRPQRPSSSSVRRSRSRSAIV